MKKDEHPWLSRCVACTLVYSTLPHTCIHELDYESPPSSPPLSPLLPWWTPLSPIHQLPSLPPSDLPLHEVQPRLPSANPFQEKVVSSSSPQQQQQQRPQWFDPTRTELLSSYISLASSGSPATVDLTHGWLRVRLTADHMPPSNNGAVGNSICITESARMTRDQYQTMNKQAQSCKHQKTSLCQKTKGVPRRVFSLRLAPTKEQKLYLQRAFGIACLAKRLAYKYLGDQRVPMDKHLMEDLRTHICTENRQTHVYPPGIKRTPKQKGGYKVVSRPNDFLPAKYRERLFETRLHQMDKDAHKFFASRQSNV